MARLATTSCSVLVAVTAISAACSSPNAGSGGATAGSGGSGTTSATNTVGHGPASSSTHAATSTTGGQGGAFVCNPPAAPGSIYEKPAVSYALDDVSMCQYRGEVLLIIDTAAA